MQIDHNLIAELEDLLGVDRLTVQYQRLLADLDEAIAQITTLLPQGPSAEIGQKAHKVAGGAAILGLVDLAAKLRACQDAVHAQDAGSLAAHVAALTPLRAGLTGLLRQRQAAA
ncbi:Hpt domain-containing protein [Cypionkella sp.]|jgi:HPt (histidine-containing phosphotransfer) domain-containing protein|uniref:Hpt domain-containing protein n=1 Tax=Cypionkella sp. TaxID=2811411 RepID=UPI002FDDEDB7